VIDIALIIVLGRTLLDSNAINGGVTTSPWDILTKPVVLTPEQITPTSKVEIPMCSFNEKLTWIPARDKYVCLPDMK